MNSTELETAIRTDAFLPAADPVFTTARVCVEATETQHTLVERAVATSNGGYWIRPYTYTCDGTTKRFRMPTRAVGGVAAGIKLGTGLIDDPTVPSGRYRFFGDYIEFKTAPDAGRLLTIEYHLRPSRIVTAQTAGRVAIVDDVAKQLSVNSIPSQQLATGGPAVLAAGMRIDIVKPNGWHQPVVVSALVIAVGFVPIIEVASDTDLSEVEAGDYVRYEDETDWPALPVDFHRMLATMTAAKVLTAKKATEAAGALLSSAQPVMERFMDIITPRVKDAPPTVKPNVGILRRRGRVYGGLPR